MKNLLIIIFFVVLFFDISSATTFHQKKVIHIPGYPMTVLDYGDHVVHQCGPNKELDCYVIEILWPLSDGDIVKPNTNICVFIRTDINSNSGYGYTNVKIDQEYDTNSYDVFPAIYFKSNTVITNNYNIWEEKNTQYYE